MTRPCALAAALSLSLTALPVLAETLSEEIGRTGLAPVETRLLSLSAATPDDRLALGAVQFLRAIEGSFQTRWRHGLTDRTGMLPLLRLPVADNPAPEAFAPEIIATIFSDAQLSLTTAHATLSAVGEAEAALEINFADLWFDVNMTGTREAEEGLMDIAGPALFGWEWTNRDPATPAPFVRFDTADAAWAAAYAKALSGFCQIVLAYDPTQPIARALDARTKMAAFGPTPPDLLTGGQGVPDSIDVVTMFLATLDQTPDAARMAAAQADFLSMVQENRRFWALVALETDDNAEWLPNARQQTSPIGPLPPGVADGWQAVLAEAEAILRGELLVPYFRVAPAAGINIARLFEDPRPVDIPGWVQGWAALPYLEAGPLATGEAWNAFAGLVGGDPMLMAIWLN